MILAGRLTAQDVGRAAAGERLELDPGALAAVAANRAVLEAIVAAGTPIYGITTGFGALVSTSVPPELHRRLQVDLLRSHAAGAGAPLPREVVRAALAVRLNGLLLGHSAIRPVVLERIVALLNGGFVPVVPRTGSLGASGDLAPSAHAFLPLVGEGEVHDGDGGGALGGGEALRRLGLAPLELEAKEGLALINGTHFMSGIGALVQLRAARALDLADAAAALSIDALRGAGEAFDARIQALRPLPGQVRSAAHVRALLAGSARTRTSGEGLLQDAYSLRCVPQVHGAAREGADFFARLVAVDLNAVTDNPILVEEPATVVSAGNFHGQSLSLAFDTLRIALADLASISERRTFRMLSPSANGGLPAFLAPTPGVSSGYMIAQYTAAALVSELRALAHPVSPDSVPTSDNQEDHVSMGMTSALMALDVVDRVETVLAIELLCACQAFDVDPGAPGRAGVAIRAAVREHVPPLADDRPPAPDIEAVRRLVADGRLHATVAPLLADPVPA